MIEVKNLKKTYTSGNNSFTALRDINVTIEKGEIFGFIGLSGAGKTSLVRCISALEEVTAGQVLIDGVDLASLKGEDLRLSRRKLGLVFQHFNLLMNSTVYENIAFPLRVALGMKLYQNKAKKLANEKIIDDKVNELMDMVGLRDKKDDYPSKLSGGQKQRVGIARALANNPSIVICDEATSALDPNTTKSILHLIKDINQKLNITFIIITHEMHVIKEVCSRLAILEDGNIIETGKVIDVFIDPQTETAKSFFHNIDTDFSNDAYSSALAKNGLILKATFVGDNAPDPFISYMVKHFNIEAAILSGNIQEISGVIIGCLVINITGDNNAVDNAIKYLKDAKVMVEVIRHGN